MTAVTPPTVLALNRETPWLVADDLPGPVRRALADVARDWRRVFATEPRLRPVSEGVPATGMVVAIGADAVALATGEQEFLADEAHRVRVCAAPDGRTVVAVAGGGVRGLIYAIYAFSERILGVDPFWFWTDQRLGQAEQVALDAGLNHHRETPRFRWRGWFCNDEDLLTAWAPSLQSSHGIALGVWDRIYETLLRTGGNFVVPGTFLFPDEPQLALAAERGLALGQHHIEVLGLNTYRWPDEVPYSYATHPEILIAAWRECVAAQQGREVVWSVGYRGRHDRPFWYDDAAAGSDDAARGGLISEAIATQVAIVRESRPDDTIVFNLWMEGVELAAAGHLRIPEGVVVVWPDDGHGEVLDGGRLAAGQGIYYHTAMHDRIASQLTEMVEVDRIAAEFRRASAAGATSHLLVNVSDVRPVVMTTQAAMDLAWNPDSPVHDFYERWAERQVGAEWAVELAALWREYFAAPWRYDEAFPDHLEDNAYQTFARGLVIAAARARFDEPYVYTTFAAHYPRPYHLLGERTVRSLAEVLATGTAQAQPVLDGLLERAIAFAEQVPAQRRDFVRGHVVTQLAAHATANRELHAVARGVVSLAEGGRTEAAGWFEQAHEAILDLLRALRAGETPGWDDWYGGDEFVKVPASLTLVELLLDALRDGEWPSEDPAFREPQDQYIRIKTYQAGRSAAPSALARSTPTDSPKGLVR